VSQFKFVVISKAKGSIMALEYFDCQKQCIEAAVREGGASVFMEMKSTENDAQFLKRAEKEWIDLKI